MNFNRKADTMIDLPNVFNGGFLGELVERELRNAALKKERILTSNYPDSKWAKLAQSLVAKE